MIGWLLKSVLCSLLLMVLFKGVFEKEHLLQFKRFYLLFALLFSLLIPFVSLQVPPVFVEKIRQTVPMETAAFYIEVGGKPSLMNESAPSETDLQRVATPRTLPVMPIILSVYAFITVTLLFRFGYNTFSLLRRARRKERIEFQGATLILLDDPCQPHCFFNFIFINRSDYKQGKIEDDILLHEWIHARQKHSADVLFVELLISLFWFNPALYSYGRAIKLNHEFLADEGVLDRTTNRYGYQMMLIEKANLPDGLSFASNFNYLTTKKRLIMIHKKTSRVGNMLRKTALLPVITGCVYAFSTHAMAADETTNTARLHENNPEETGMDQAGSMPDTINKTEEQSVVQFTPPVMIQDNQKKANTKQSDQTPRKNTIRFVPPRFGRDIEPGKGATDEQIQTYQSILAKYGTTAKELRSIENKVSPEEREQLIHIFTQMNEEERSKQNLNIQKKFPPEKKAPTAAQLQEWKDPQNFGIWINGKKVGNRVLNDYSNSDFAHFYINQVTDKMKENNVNIPQVGLTTKEQYEKELKQYTAEPYIFMYQSR